MPPSIETKRDYFVDEAGDAALFGSKGKVLIGSEGCSQYFILGVLDVEQPELLAQELQTLRAHLLADSYFAKIPSMQPEARKTYFAFHAKDDIPEVRREVYALLHRHELRFLAVVRNKWRVLEYVQRRNVLDLAYRYNQNELYDYMVRVLFKNLLHKDSHYAIYFAKRWKQDRTEALQQALITAQNRFIAQSGKHARSRLEVTPQAPQESGGLQAADYFLWALQRFYERREDRYLEYIWPSVRLVHDLDDTRDKPYGVYYTQKKPLTLAALENDQG